MTAVVEVSPKPREGNFLILEGLTPDFELRLNLQGDTYKLYHKVCGKLIGNILDHKGVDKRLLQIAQSHICSTN